MAAAKDGHNRLRWSQLEMVLHIASSVLVSSSGCGERDLR